LFGEKSSAFIYVIFACSRESQLHYNKHMSEHDLRSVVLIFDFRHKDIPMRNLIISRTNKKTVKKVRWKNFGEKDR
jgi:hypothetical protein